MPKDPLFLRQQATKQQGQPGTRSKTGVFMMSQVIQQMVEAFKNLIRPAAPQQTRKASASPLARGPFSDVVRGPAPPPGAIRHDHSEDDNGNESH